MAANPNTNFTPGQILTADEQNRFPRGVVGYALSTADRTYSTTTVDITGMTATFTAVANRLYRATFEGFINNASASLQEFLMTDASNNQLDQGYNQIGAASFTLISFQYLFTSTAGSRTIKMRANTNAGTTTIYGATANNRSHSFVIEDLGPA